MSGKLAIDLLSSPIVKSVTMERVRCEGRTITATATDEMTPKKTTREVTTLLRFVIGYARSAENALVVISSFIVVTRDGSTHQLR